MYVPEGSGLFDRAGFLATIVFSEMEYDTSTLQGNPIQSAAGVDQNDNRGHARIPSRPVDVSILKAPITFAFSGRIAKNRLLKAPMTERLCRWNKEGEDIVILNVWFH